MKTGINPRSKVAFTNVNVVAMKDSSIQSNRTVLIENGIIKHIKDTSTPKPEGYFIIDGSGKYLTPSLVDMHVHLGDNEDDLLLFLVNGVTTIRNMWGYENFRLRNWLFGTRVFNHLALRDKVNAGEPVGPTIYTAGPMNEGEKPFFPKFMVNSLKSTEEAEQMVMDHVTKGYDLVKFYSTISEDIFNAIIRSAKEHGIAVAGHVPDLVGLEKVINAQVTSVEHLLGFFNPYRQGSELEESEISRLADLSARNNVYHCPTLIASERICNTQQRQTYKNEPEMVYLPKRVKKGMQFLQNASSNFLKKKNLKPNHEYMPYLFNVIRELKKRDARMLLGTDKATPYVVSGFSVHKELNLLCKAGLSPFEALEAGTINAAKCLNRADETGTIEAEKIADLLLVKSNPLTDIDALRTHCGVMTKGRWISRNECDSILNEIKIKNI